MAACQNVKRLNKQIAHEMAINERTVKLYRAQVMGKMAAESLAELVKQAENDGLHPPAGMKTQQKTSAEG